MELVQNVNHVKKWGLNAPTRYPVQLPILSLAESMTHDTPIFVCSAVKTLSNNCSYIKNLESRLRVLERLATSRIDEASIANEEDLSSTPSSVDVDDIENDASDNQGALIINVQPMASDEQAETDDTDGMAVSLVDDNDPGYFGKHLVNTNDLTDC